MSTSNIEWTDRVWNPVTGCTKVSKGCQFCYAEVIANRKLPHGGFTDRKFTDVRTHTDRLTAPLSWRKPSKIFVNSMSDLFHEAVPFEFIAAVFGIMAAAKNQTFQILTKRPERMREFMAWIAERDQISDGTAEAVGQALAIPSVRDYMTRDWDDSGQHEEDENTDDYADLISDPPHWPLVNVWLGVSVENQETADEHIPLLLKTPAAIRFVSYEPALGPIDFTHMDVEAAGDKAWCWINALTGRHTDMGRPCPSVPKLDWIIVGGESGPKARPFDTIWAHSAVEQCQAAGVAVFVKQLGAVPMMTDARWRACSRVPLLSANKITRVPADCVPLYLDDRKGGDMAEWPESLRVREFPAVRS